MEVVERVMLEDRRHWEASYAGDEQAVALQRRYSYSDRVVRYYWNDARVKAAVEKLMNNLHGRAIPETMLSAYLPAQYRAVRSGVLKPDAEQLILHRIREVAADNAGAC